MPHMTTHIRTPADHDRFRAALAPVDEAFRASEQRWGVGRLERLVSALTLAAYKRGWDAYREALDAGDGAALEIVGPKMVAALAFMDAEATRAGHEPLSVVTWETPLSNGTVLVIVRTQAEASAVLRALNGQVDPDGQLPPDLALLVRQQHEGRRLVVWTMAEIGRLLEASIAPSATKETWPGAVIIGGTTWAGTPAPSGVQRDEMSAYDHARSGWPLSEALT